MKKFKLLFVLLRKHVADFLYKKLHHPQSLDAGLAEQLNSYQPHTTCRRAVARVINYSLQKGLLTDCYNIRKVAQPSDGINIPPQ